MKDQPTLPLTLTHGAGHPRASLLSVLWVFVYLLFTGCALMETDKKTATTDAQELTAKQSSTASGALKGHIAPLPNVEVDGKGNSLEITVPPMPVDSQANFTGTTDAEASSDRTLLSEYSRYLPLGFSLLFVGIGLIVVVFAVKYARRSSAALNAGLGLADQGIAQVIGNLHSLSTQQVGNSNPLAAALNLEIAKLEKARGKIKGNGHAKT